MDGKLFVCDHGDPGALIDDCASEGACGNGRCLSPTCLEAEKDRTSFAGCLFYTAELDNVASDAALATSFLVSNPGDQPAVAVLQRLSTGGGWTPTDTVVVPQGKSARMSRPPEMRLDEAGPRIAGALRVWSNRPVTVEQIQSDDSDESALSSGGTVLLPVHVLGTRHRVMTYKQVGSPAVVATENSAGGAGRLLIIGTQPGTRVTFRRSKYATGVVTGPSSTVAPSPEFFDLGDGDTFLAWTANEGDDLTGSEIESSLPVAVFSGNISTSYGRTAPLVHSPDMAHEQMPPVTAWSRKYVAAALPPQAGVCDTLLGTVGAPPGASIWRLLADEDSTAVKFTGPEGVPPVHDDVTMAAGEVLEFVATGDFVVSASKMVLLTQGIDCEPSLSLAISADKLLQDVTFAVLPMFDHMLAVVRPTNELSPNLLAQSDPVLLDGIPIGDKLFKPAGGGYEVARVWLNPQCPASQKVCTHRLQGRFGVTLRGMDILASYATTLPAWCFDGPDPMCVQ